MACRQSGNKQSPEPMMTPSSSLSVLMEDKFTCNSIGNAQEVHFFD